MKIFNSLTQKKEVFKPIEAGKVKLYVCGVTVYDYSHIGHARSLIIFDMVVRYLRMRGYEVTFVRNITDIDDKIIKSAQENKENPVDLANRFIQILHEDQKVLKILPPDVEPRVTEYISEIIIFIEKLLKSQYAYIGENRDVYFNVRSFDRYGKLSHRNFDEFYFKTRLAINENKNNALDFVLWKKAKPGEPRWKSPWGEGRPGWHIECSVMSSNLLGQPFDIHGGGIDLKFPHHENEIAQSEVIEEKKLANLWMHSGLLKINKAKMSKSTGNTISIRNALKKNHIETLRYFLLSSHYRSPVNYSEENLSNSRVALERFYSAMHDLPITVEESEKDISRYTNQFYQAMDNDFNTPIAFSVLFDMVRTINRLRTSNQIKKAVKVMLELKRLSNVFGLLNHPAKQFLHGTDKIASADIAKINALITIRNKVRDKKDWKSADKIRDQLTALGVSIKDLPGGSTSWKRYYNK
ncbi:cysteine--tRNA ligase [Coxiella endosymbiont of Amblyomma americanum]|uniref:cysteine--tRNA ligase n=1 Tax=Coxiella endosymbiont of Amblyomma americanum TaxID=325775 RepID=UPI00057E423D|nr:cysteine--tRNA ligase [Coxiella endosymbiont of Amblyomma americanum]AJC50257.1 cysteinyl-tRNA synthetase [Coxiella endosymbiont of Amblyomma americanum]AUJ58615.1 cysteine--tRNA ligase [Coxiella-like endosymbiont of Amblyomma americanum]